MFTPIVPTVEDIRSGELISTSYRHWPEHVKRLTVSYRTEEDKKVLNDDYISQSTGSENGSSKETSTTKETVPEGGVNRSTTGLVQAVGNNYTFLHSFLHSTYYSFSKTNALCTTLL